MRFTQAVGAEEPELQLAPMIDVIFQLIIFFLCASTFNPSEAELSVNLPVAPSTAKQTVVPDEVEITILSDGVVVINDKEYDSSDSHLLPELRGMLEGLISFSDKQPVIIAPSPDVYHGRVVEVLNACAAARVKNISFYATL